MIFPARYLNKIICQDSRDLSFLPDNCVHLMITSPPYNVGKEYEENLSLDEYLIFIHKVMREMHRILIPGGRACINIANTGRKPYIPLNGHMASIMDDIGFLMRGEVIWNKGISAGSSTAWGSWKSATNPILRDVHEYILVFSKGNFKREKPENQENTINKDEFLEYTKSIWSFKTESAKKIGHPAPFPVELPYRLIQLYSFAGDIVIDPFCGSGTTCLAAMRTGRKYVGIDNNQEYVDLAKERIGAELIK